MEGLPAPEISHNEPRKAAIRCVTCPECGRGFKTTHGFKSFCSAPCQIVFKNRRMQRGMELYDFAMAKRYQREHEKDARSIIDALCMGYREQDVRSREGRPSWYPFRDALDDLPRLPGVADGR